MIELIFQRKLILVKQLNQENVIFCHYCYFLDIKFNYEKYLCNGCHNLMQKAIILMMLLLSLLKGMIAEIIFGT